MTFLSLMRRLPRWLQRASLPSPPHAELLKRCQVEPLEKRNLLAGDIHLGAVYFEEATGDDSAGDRIEITFEGGQPGTQMTRVIIDTDKDGLGLSTGDLFFDTRAGEDGLGAFNASDLQIIAAQGFQVLGTSVADGGTRLIINLSGFDAGEKLVLTIDVDEAQFVSGGEVDVNPLVEGAEFQRSKLTGTFTAPHYFDITGSAQFFDAYDAKFQQLDGTNGTHLNLPPDSHVPPDTTDHVDRTAGAAVLIHQDPKPVTISGNVFHDVNLNNTRNDGEGGIGGVTLELWKLVGGQYERTEFQTTTNSFGDYKFESPALLPGTYRVVEVQPGGYFSVGAAAGTIDGATSGVVETPDGIKDIVLRGGQASIRNDFAEAQQAELHGHVFYDADNDGVFDAGELGIEGVTVRVQFLPTSGPLPDAIVITTGPGGVWSATGLRPGAYRITEVTPIGYFDGLDRPGDAGGAAENPGDEISGVFLFGGQIGRNYDFGELLPGELRGRVHADTNGDCILQPGEALLGGVEIRLLNGAGNLVATTTTNNQGEYVFAGLVPGVYTIVEVQPAGYYDGGEEVGAAGGNITANDTISGIVLPPGMVAAGYDFCELPPSTIRGRVHADANGDCIFQPGERLLSGVEIRLFGPQGNLLATTITNANGEYEFKDIAPGNYTIVEVQPAGYFDGGEEVGTAGGTVSANDTISNIQLAPDVTATGYDFCENEPVSISGFVFVDLNDNCVREGSEAGIAGVTITLLDAAGNSTGRSTVTDANGFYRFDGLAPGLYGVAEAQPATYIDGQDCPGNAGGTAEPSDRLIGAALNPGVHGTNYNFGELLPSTITGRVHADRNGDCVFQSGENLLAGVEVRLLDAQGNVLRTTTTGSDGVYRFDGLAPGVYTVFEVQPAAYFDGGEEVGTAGGIVSANDTISGITLGPGVTATGYDFCEHEPVSISGFVYVDVNNNGVRDAGESAIAGATLFLLDGNGAPTTRTVVTDANGFYRFDGLAPGTYGVSEQQPGGYFDGRDAAGSAGGSAANPGDTITGAQLTPGVHATDYNFGELLPSSIRGRVHADLNGDCILQPGEPLIAGVEMRLLDESGNVLATTKTNADGVYEFTNLAPGIYGLLEVQPAGYFDGGEELGTAGGFVSNDFMSGINLGPGVNATDYDFCELLPASLAGRVFSDPDGDTLFDAATGSAPIVGAVVELLNSAGNVIGTTTTDANGFYRFTNLAPGVYGIHEQQPGDYFDGDELVGNAGGRLSGNDLMVEIELTSGENGVEYNFAELPPATLSGYVFQDGPVIVLQQGESLDVARVRDGRRTADDRPLANVIVLLADEFGNVLRDTLRKAISAVTDANGFYQFSGLHAGVYSVVQEQPANYLDGLDTAGTAGGLASNGAPVLGASSTDEFSRQVYPANDDAIYRIQIRYGQTAEEYNFSEVLTQRGTLPIISTPPFLIPPVERNAIPVLPPPLTPPGIPLYSSFLAPLPGGGAGGVGGRTSWHLSVIDAGQPRGPQQNQGSDVRLTNAHSQVFAWRRQADVLNQSRWSIRRQTPARELGVLFGSPGAIPITGDFNGDGVSEVGVYIAGHWFIDLNGNGVWDDDDLWVRLGSKEELPVTGDWDGDGKTDIGIYGPEWPGDPRHVAREPGLPDAENIPTAAKKNVPPASDEAADGQRWMKLTATGREREDVIDHVFYYGAAEDLPVAGDWNGDGVDTIGVFRDGQWHLDVDGTGTGTSKDRGFTFGQPGDRPVVGDFDGDGVDQVGVFRHGVFHLDSDNDRRLTARDEAIEYGPPNGQPVAEDFDGDGADDVGVYHESAPVSSQR